MPLDKLIVALTTLLLLAGCCGNTESDDCTDAENKMARERHVPQLVTERDGVKVYYLPSSNIYFTTPCGDVQWEEQHGKTHETKRINGTGCK